MTRPIAEPAAVPTSPDVRLVGFATRVAVAAALSWVERHVTVLETETISVACAAHRVLASPVRSRIDRPATDCAARDGYAVRASDTEAADSYTPLPLRLTNGAGWRPGDAAVIASGSPMPPGADAVLSFEVAAPHNETLAVMAPVAPGSGVLCRGSDAEAGREVLAAGRRLRANDPAFLTALGVAAVEVVLRPSVTVLVIGAKAGGTDLLSPALLSMVARDGGIGIGAAPGASLPAAIVHAASRSTLVIVAGRSGAGADDDAAPALLAAGGTLSLHGIALQPGESTGIGQLGMTPVLLLPGEPLAGLAAYEMVAAPAIRRFSGLPAPGLAPTVQLSRKIVSTIGMVELVFVRVHGACATPLPADGLAWMHADGYVVVPETSEGFAAGARVPFHACDAGSQTGVP